MKANNPYVGPRAFEEEDSRNFFGRKEETRQLASLVIAHRVVLLYAPSGAGKTSLLKAGLIPYLKQRKRIKILPICRVGGDLPPDVDGNRVKNIYVLNTLVNLVGETAQTAELLNQPLIEGLTSYLTPQSDQQRALPSLLIIDQFEELFTTHPGRYPERADFFLQLQHSLQQTPNLSLLLAMREDYIAQLDPYAAQLPDRLRTRFRLELLGEEAAHQAVKEPARKVNVNFTETAAQQLVNDLRKVQVQQADDTTKEQLGRYVEPVQLQVVCRRLWEQLPDDATQIGTNDIETVGNVDTALADYYADCTARTEEQTKVRERTIREWFDRKLITEQGIRGQVLRGPEKSQGLDNLAISPLVDVHLVRAEKRLNATWYELAHDRLIEPIRRNNAEWFQEHLSPLQRQADLWESQNRPHGLLLRDEALEEAEHWAADHQDELTLTEKDFLATCQEARTIAEREQRQARRIRRLALVSIIIGIIAIIAAVFAMIQRQSAQENAEIAKVRATEAEDERNRARKIEKQRTRSLFESHLTHASLLARIDDYAAARKLLIKSRELDEDIPAERRHTRNFMAWFTDLMGSESTYTYTGAKTWLYSLAVSPDGRLLATVGERGFIILFDVNSGKQLKRWQGHTGTVNDVVFHPKGTWLVTGGDDGRIIFWSLPDGKILDAWETQFFKLTEQSFKELHKDGFPENLAKILRPIAHQAMRGEKAFLDAVEKLLGKEYIDKYEKFILKRAWKGQVNALALDPDGHRLASGGTDNTVTLWDVNSGNILKTLDKHTDSIPYGGLAFSPDGKLLASASYDKTARIWNLHTGDNRLLDGHTSRLTGLAFHPDGKILATSSDDRSVRLWNVASGERIRELFGHKNEVYGLAFIDAGRRLVSASGDRTLRIWDTSSGVTLKVLQGHTGSVANVVTDGEHLFSASADHTLRRWDIRQEETQRMTKILELSGEPTSSAISPDGANIAVGFANGTLHLYTLPEGRRLFWKQTEMHQEGIYSVVFSPDNRYLASASLDKTVKLWQVSDGQLYKTFRGPTEIYKITFSPDSTLLASAGLEGQIGLFKLSEREGRFYKAHERDVYSVAFDNQNQRLLSSGGDNEIRLWSLDTWPPAMLHSFLKNQDLTMWVAFSSDGNRIVSVGRDRFLRIINAQEGTKQLLLEGHENTIYRAVFSPDSGQVATVSTDATVRLWDLTAEQELFKLRLPDEIGLSAWDFDFRCAPLSTSRWGKCWIVVPLTNGRLVLYHLGQPYK